MATLVLDFIPATLRGVRGNAKMFLEAAFGEDKAQKIRKYTKYSPFIGVITGEFEELDKFLDASGNLRAEAKAWLMESAKEQGGMTGAVIAGVCEGIADTILAIKTMQTLNVGYGQEAVKAGAPWFAKSWSVVKSAAVRAGIMTARTPHDNPKEFAKAYGLSLAYQSTPAISRHFKDTASVIAADIALNSVITVTQVKGLIDAAWAQAEAEGGTPEEVERNAAIYATISMIQTIGSDIVFGAMTRAFKDAPPPVRDALEQAKAQAAKVGNDLPTAKPMPVPVDDSVRGPETNPVLATPERPVLISNQPEAARSEEGVRISAPEEPAARVNPLLEPERVAQAATQAERPAEPQTEAARPAEQVAAPEAARPPIEQARDEAGAPRQAPPAEVPLATRYTPEQLAEIKAAQEKLVGEMRGPGEAQAAAKPPERTPKEMPEYMSKEEASKRYYSEKDRQRYNKDRQDHQKFLKKMDGYRERRINKLREAFSSDAIESRIEKGEVIGSEKDLVDAKIGASVKVQERINRALGYRLENPAYNPELPPGYTREGDLYVFKGEAQGEKPAPRTAADLAKPVAAHAKGAVVEAMRGLAELVKADPSKLGSGPVMFDEKNYAKAKVHFQKAWVEAKAAGNSVKEFSDYVVAQLGDAIRPFLARFVEEVERSEEWGDKVADARQVDPNTGLRVTAPMKAVGDQEREGFGVKPREPVFTREWDDAVISEARAQISSADKIIAESRKGQRAVTDTDIATMLIAKTERINARVEAANAMKANPDDPAAQKAFTQAQERLTEVYEAIEKAGTTSGRALAAMKMTMDERYGVVENMEWELRAAKGGKEVTPAERTNLERIQQQYVREKAQYEKQVALAKEQYADLEERLGTLEAQIFYDRDIPRLDPATLEKMAEGGRLYSLGLDPDRVTSIAKWMLGKMAKGIKNPNELALKHLGEEARPTINAARAEAAEMAAKAGKGASKQRTGKTKGQPTPASEIRDLYRAQIEAGVREVNEATRNVTAEWNKTHGADAQMTEKQIRDTFSDYGKVIPLTKDEVKRALSELRREAQLTSSIERAMNDLHPLKTGRQRFPPTSEARQMLKTLNNLLKEKGLNAVDPERQLKSAMDARKSRMRDAIEDKKRAIETLQRLAPNKKPPELDAEGQRLKAELDRITEEYNKVFPKEKTSLTDQERLKIATRAAERSLRDVVKELKDARNGIFAMKKRYPNLPNDEYLAGLRAKKRIAQQEVRELRELANPGMKALQDRIKRIQGAIRLYDNKLTTGDFSPRRVNEVDISQNPLAMLEQARLNYLKAEFNKRKEEARFSALPPAEQRIERFQEQAKTWFNYFRNIKSSYDFSGIGRQGGLMMLSDPVQWAKSIPNSLRVYKSEKAGMEYWEGFKKRSNYELYAKAKLGISPGDGRGNFGPADDIFRPDIAAKVPLVKRHMRSFAVILNEMRANLFDKLLANSENPRDVSDEKIRRIANLVNTWTGRGQLPKGWDAETLGYIFWAPRFVSASFDVATMPVRMAVGSVFARGNPYRDEVRKMAAMQYVKAIGSLVALYSASYAMSFLDEENEFYLETNPTSADFGSIQVPFSTQKVNPLTWVRPTATFLARMISGEMLTAEKQKQQLAPWPWVSQEAKEAGYGMRGGIKETLYDFAQTKQNPAYNALLQILTGKDFYGNDMNRAWAAFTGIAPLVPTSAPNLLKSETGIWTDAKEKRLEKLPVFAALYVLAMIGSQPRASDYKSPRQLKINLTKENYAKRVRLAVLRGTFYKVVKGVINSTAAPEARAYLEQFLEEDGADALRAALKAEFSERRKAQKDRAGRMRTDDAESKRRLQLNRLIRAYEKEQKKQEEDKRRRGLERAAQKGQIA